MFHGGWCWKKVLPMLRAAGHDVDAPTLTGLGERVHLQPDELDLHTHIQDVVNVFDCEDLHDVILVGHSFGGCMEPAIAEVIPDRIAHLVNVDGPSPENNKAMKDLIGNTWDFFVQHAIQAGDPRRIPPAADWTFGVSGADLAWMQAKLTPHPLKPLTTPISLANPLAHSIPRTFIHCTEGLSADEIGREEARWGGWGGPNAPSPVGTMR